MGEFEHWDSEVHSKLQGDAKEEAESGAWVRELQSGFTPRMLEVVQLVILGDATLADAARMMQVTPVRVRQLVDSVRRRLEKKVVDERVEELKEDEIDRSKRRR